MAKPVEAELGYIRVSTFILFIQTAQMVLKYSDAYLYRKLRLSVSKLIALQALSRASEGMIPSEIARWTSTERHNITTLISRMKKEKLVTTERNSTNKRLVKVKLTNKGREVYNQSIPVAAEIFNQVMLSITEGDAKLLKEKCGIMRQNAIRGLKDLTDHAARAH